MTDETIGLGVDVALLCDAAAVDDHSGKLSMVGVFDALYVERVPVRVAGRTLALRLSMSGMEGGRRALGLRLRDSRGDAVDILDGDLDLGTPAPALGVTYAYAVTEIPAFDVTAAGVYTVDVLVDGKVLHVMPLSVRVHSN